MQSVWPSPTIGYICLPLGVRQHPPRPGLAMTISGWGAESEKGKQNPVLKKAVVYLISNEWCQNAYPDRIISKESKMCAVADNVDTCQGDSGGK